MARVLTPTHCLNEFKLLFAAVTEWENDNRQEIFVQWSQNMIKGFTLKLEKAFERFFDETADFGNTVLADSRLMIIAIDSLFAEYGKFKKGIAEESPSCSPSGTDGLWRAYLAVRETFKQAVPLSKPLPIKQMMNDGVSLNQIATIYGWFDENGAPDVLKVTEEMETPGTHYNPKTWVHPALAKRQERIDKEWAERMENVKPREKIFEVNQPKPKVDWQVPSIAVMVQAGAPAEQIANVHKITVEEAQMYLDEANAEKAEAENTSSKQLANV